METFRVKKGPIILPLILLAVVLGVYTLSHFQFASAADCLTLGQQHLSNLDYEGAIMEFTNAIELDPNSVDARVGLAQAYVGTENYEMAKQILEPMVDTQQPVESAAVTMADLLERTNQQAQAIGVVRTLIELTDRDEYYDLLNRLMVDLRSRPRSFAAGTDHTLLLRDGQVLSRGSNLLGQLGLAVSIPSAGRLTNAQFSGDPVKVACVGRTSFVIDSAGGLWAAGENRWGQWGEGYAITAPEGGWNKLSSPGSVAAVAGTTGRLLVLLDDGTLWTAGAENGQNFSRLFQFPLVVEIAASQERAAVLTADGTLYVSDSRTPTRWELAGRNVCSFTLSDNALCWVNGNSEAYVNYSMYSIPEECQESGGVTALAQVNRLSLCVTQGQHLWRILENGQAEEVAGPSVLTAMYPQGQQLILEYEDGTVQCWDADRDMPRIAD